MIELIIEEVTQKPVRGARGAQTRHKSGLHAGKVVVDCRVGGPPVRLQHSHLAVVKTGVKSVRQYSMRYVAAKLRPTAASAGRPCASSAVTGP